MSLPRITVVTPSYNQGHFLDQTIRSVLDQNYPNLEYIVCDGGSKDDSVEIIKKYQDRLAWWVSERDKGQTDAINKGFRRATGELHCYINSDDLLDPGSLMAAAQAFSAGHQWITGWVRFIEPDGGEWPQLPMAHHSNIDWFMTNPICQQATYWNARYTREFGGFREDMHFAFDYEFWMRLLFEGKLRPLMLRRCMGAYRLHDASKTMSQYESFRKEFKIVREMYHKYLSPPEMRDLRRRRNKFESERHRLDGWKAMKSSDVPTARKHAREALRRRSWSPEVWRLMFCAIRGY
ncbi:MAG TPA: glycosyltransferase family 2 protein [Humisphaera sp.]|jgi:glycosyltransferase involved in cell wall biosynthesis|nr:glycosyltransferase family 2 protein [Humisphaera sp.]